MDQISEAAEKEYEKRQSEFTESDVEKVIDKEKKIQEKFENKGKLKRFADDAMILISLIKDYATGNYREIPWNIIASVGAALLYVLSPIDLIPDFLPMVGYLDDAAVIAFCLSLIEKDLAAYKVWKDNQKVAG